MPRRRPNPKKKSVRKREVDEWLQSGRGQALLATLELQESCPELTHDALRRRQHFDESTNSFSFDLSRCSMTELPASIGSWKMSPKPLIELNLSACAKLYSLPDEIGELSALMSLDLSRCSSLAALPDSIGELSALRRLELSMCSSLAALPDSIGKLKALKTLCLVYCTSLCALPDTINELGVLDALWLAGSSNLILSRDALNGLGALQDLHLSGCVKIESLHLDKNLNLKTLFALECPNLGLTRKTILALHKQRAKVQGISVRDLMRDLRNKAKRRRQRRLCDYCGRQGGIDEPRLPVCYCGERRYCDETCQRAGWAAEHSKTCLFGVFLTAEQIALLQRLEECYLHGLYDDVVYSHHREEYLKMTPAEAQDMFEKARQHMPDGFFSGGPCQWA